MDGKTIADISFVYEDGSLIKPYDASGFQKKYGIQMKNKKDGITLFMQMIGLKLPYQEVPKYQNKTSLTSPFFMSLSISTPYFFISFFVLR